MSKALFKTTIVIWTDVDPNSENLNIVQLANYAFTGDAICSKQVTELVEKPNDDIDAEGTNVSRYFANEDEENDEQDNDDDELDYENIEDKEEEDDDEEDFDNDEVEDLIDLTDDEISDP